MHIQAEPGCGNVQVSNEAKNSKFQTPNPGEIPSTNAQRPMTCARGSRGFHMLDGAIRVFYPQHQARGVGGGDGDFAIGIGGGGGNTPDTFLSLGNFPHAVLEIALEAGRFWQFADGDIGHLMFGKVAPGQHGVLVIRRGLSVGISGGAGDDTDYNQESFHNVIGECGISSSNDNGIKHQFAEKLRGIAVDGLTEGTEGGGGHCFGFGRHPIAGCCTPSQRRAAVEGTGDDGGWRVDDRQQTADDWYLLR